ncbi:MAG: polyprenyl synthetase family protein [Oscillospiraceae bacterium]
MDYQQEYEQCRELIEARLNEFFVQECPQKELLDAMRYSLLAGGKRIRPVLTVKFCEAAGGTAAEALDFACGAEMLHTYSLIHDDLPCMDNDDLRRGKPTCHKVFGETVATLAGDALQAAAFRTVLTADGAWSDPSAPGAAASILAQAAGENGMCGGQYLDTVGDGKPHTVEELKVIHAGKTGALLRAACLMGVIACSGYRKVDYRSFEAAKGYAENLGMAFQIQDDILDVTATTEVLGKPAGSDAANQKTTFVTLLGVPACRDLVREHTDRAKAALDGVFPDSGFLCWLADRLAEREN